jgi:hypothetical protein
MSTSTSQVGLGGSAVDEESLEEATDDEEQPESTQEQLVDPNEVEPPSEAPQTREAGSDESSAEDSRRSEESGLQGFGVDEDNRANITRLDQPDGEMKQDRRTNTRSEETDSTEQAQLYPDVEDDQRTLTGARAGNQCLFEDQ